MKEIQSTSWISISGKLVLLLVGGGSFAGIAARAQENAAPAIALVGGRIVTQTPAGVVTGAVLVQGGKIAGVGAIEIPENARRIDASGMVITPGLIDARSCLWLDAAAAREGATDGGLNVLDGIDPFSEDWREVVRQGVTAVYVQPATSGVFGGRGAVLRVAPGRSVDELLIQSDAGAQGSLGLAGRAPSSRERRAHYEQIKSALNNAKLYDDAWKKYESSKPSSAGKSPSGKSLAGQDAGGKEAPTSGAAKPPARDPARDFLRRVLSGEVPLRLEAHSDDCLASALQLASEFSIRIVLEGVSRPSASLLAIRSRRVPRVLGPVVELDAVPEYRSRRPENWLTELVDDDVRWALATFGEHPRASRLLRVQAAGAVAQGVPPERVLRALTQHAAAILGVDDRLGSIVAGHQADLAVFAGEPLDPTVPVRMVISRGQVVYEADVKPVAEMAKGNSPDGNIDRPLPVTYVIKSNRCWTESGRLEPRSILVASGRIAAVEAESSFVNGPPGKVRVFDVGSAVVTPGLVVAHNDRSFGSEIDEPVDADASYLRAVDGLDPRHPRLRRFARNGFLALAYAPGSSNVLAGSVGLIRPEAAEPIQSEFLAGKFVLTASARSNERYPASLAGQYELIEQALTARPLERTLFIPGLVQDQLEHERRRHLEAVLSRQRVAMFEARTEAELEAALKLIERFQLRAVLVGPDTIEPLLPELQRLAVGIVARPVRSADHDRYLGGLVQASRMGISVAFGMGSAEQIRSAVALAVNAGMNRESALLALTSGAAGMLGMTGGAGRIELQQPADLVIWNGSPLDPSSRAKYVIIDGQLTE